MQHSSGKYPYKAYSATLDLLPIGCSARNYFTEIIYAKHFNIKILKLGHCPNALLGLPGAYRASADDLLMNYFSDAMADNACQENKNAFMGGQPSIHLTGKVKVNIVLGWNGHSVACCRTKTPVA
jgi:hypothetical protein